MAYTLTMPRLGLTMEEGSVVEWHKKDGDTLKAGEAIFAVETDKAVQDFEAPVGGVLHLAAEVAGQQVPFAIPVEGLIGYILEPGEAPPEAGAARPAVAGATASAASPAAQTSAPARGRVKVTPLARKLAEQNGIDLATVLPADGEKIQASDIEAAVAALPATPLPSRAPAAAPPSGAPVASAPTPVASPAPADTQAVPMTQTRQVIAQRMAESARTTAAVTITTEADATELVAFREKAKVSLQAAGLPVPTYNDLIVKLTALSLSEHPALNAYLAGDKIIRIKDVHMAVAVDTEAGLLVPVIRDALHKTVQEISLEAKELSEKARGRKLGPDELQGGTFTITNLGVYGIDAFTPIINLPQCAILGVGRIISKPAGWQGQICLRSMLALSLTFDHRVVDGGPAARFLQRVRQYVEDPHLWLTR